MGILTGFTLSLVSNRQPEFFRAHSFIKRVFIRAHDLSEMEENITHIVVIEKDGIILGAGSYAPAKDGIQTVFDIGAAPLIAIDHPLAQAPRSKVAEWDSIALLPKDEFAKHVTGNIARIRSAMIDAIYAKIFLHAVRSGVDFVTMIGAIKVGECCRRVGVRTEHLGRADDEAIKKAFPSDHWDHLFSEYPRECFVADLRKKHVITRILTQTVILHSGCDEHTYPEPTLREELALA